MSIIDDLLVTIDDKPGITKEEILAISNNPQQKSAIYSALSRLLARGFITESSGYKVTVEGKKRLDYYLDGLNEFKNKNKSWGLILVEIPETDRLKREKLRYEFKKIGVGTLKKGVYIAFTQNWIKIEGLLQKLNLAKSTHILKINTINFSQAEKIARSAWDWQKLNSQYQQFLQNYENFTKTIHQHSSEIQRIEAKKAVFKLAKLLLKDPKISDELTTPGYARPQALIIYEQIRPYCYL